MWQSQNMYRTNVLRFLVMLMWNPWAKVSASMLMKPNRLKQLSTAAYIWAHNFSGRSRSNANYQCGIHVADTWVPSGSHMRITSDENVTTMWQSQNMYRKNVIRFLVMFMWNEVSAMPCWWSLTRYVDNSCPQLLIFGLTIFSGRSEIMPATSVAIVRFFVAIVYQFLVKAYLCSILTLSLLGTLKFLLRQDQRKKTLLSFVF